MTLLACGINYLTAPVELREGAAFAPDQAKMALQELIQLGAAHEAMILSTCNRVEIYTETANPVSLKHWIQHNLHFSHLPLEQCWYTHQEQQAVSHIMRVASGLDSMEFGESPIVRQMKDAFKLAQEAGTIGTRLQRLLQRVFNVSKQVRTDTQISANPITMGHAVATLGKRIFSELTKCDVLLIGAGEITELTALHLYNQGIKRFIVASRSQAKAERLVNSVHGHWITLADIPLYLKEADIVISATASDIPILGKGTVERAIKARKHRPIFMVDLAVPRDIEPEVAQLEDVYLYNIDDLKTIVDANRQCRQDAAQQAEAIIELQAQHFIRDLQALDANKLIKQFRDNLKQISTREMQRAQICIDQGADPKQTMYQLVHNLINKISHAPCTQMKQAAFDGRLEMLASARQLLNLE